MTITNENVASRFCWSHTKLKLPSNQNQNKYLNFLELWEPIHSPFLKSNDKMLLVCGLEWLKLHDKMSWYKLRLMEIKTADSIEGWRLASVLG